MLQNHRNEDRCHKIETEYSHLSRYYAQQHITLIPLYTAPKPFTIENNGPLRIATLNVGGHLLSRSNEINAVLQETKPDILLLQETHLSNQISELTAANKFPSYNLLFNSTHSHNKSNPGTGLAFALHSDITAQFTHTCMSKRHHSISCTELNITIHNIYMKAATGRKHDQEKAGVLLSTEDLPRK